MKILNGIAFNGKPQASLLHFASACGSPLNKNAQYVIKSTTASRRNKYKSANAPQAQ